jgi:hypothetical protein
MNTPTIHRRSNGTIDVDIYRAQADRERTATLNVSLQRVGALLRTAIETLAEGAKASAVRRPMPEPGITMLIAQAAPRRRD